MKLSNRRSKFKKVNVNELSVQWKKLDIILGKIILSLLGLMIVYLINYQNNKTNERISDTTQKMENLRTELSNKINQGQLASSLMDPLLRGSESERLAALFILENSVSDEFSETVSASVALMDKNERVRIEAIKVLDKKGKSAFAQQILERIKEKGSTAKERKVATKAHLEVTERAKAKLYESLRLARIYYENQLYQSSAEEFKKIENLLTGERVNTAELALAKVTYELKDYKIASQHYIKATERIK